MDQADRIYNIPEGNIHAFRKIIERLSRKAEKLTGDTIPLVVFGYHEKEISKHETIRVYEVLLGGEAPKLNGWEFVAKLDHSNKEAGNIVRPLPGITQIPAKYLTSGHNCEHCGINRFRRNTYVVKNQQGEYKQVGKTCLSDFLGHQSPDAIAKLAELHISAVEAVSRYQFSQGDDRRYLRTAAFLQTVAYVTRVHGFVSKSTAMKNDTSSSASAALSILFDHRSEEIEITDADIKLAKAAIEWAKGLDEEVSTYNHNLKTLANTASIEFRNAAFAAGIIGSYLKTTQVNTVSENKHIGVVGDRNKFDLFFDGQTTYETQYGMGVRIKFKDAQGNRLVWFTSKLLNVDVGAPVKVLATIKKHDVYQNTNLTILTRCRVS